MVTKRMYQRNINNFSKPDRYGISDFGRDEIPDEILKGINAERIGKHWDFQNEGNVSDHDIWHHYYFIKNVVVAFELSNKYPAEESCGIVDSHSYVPKLHLAVNLIGEKCKIGEVEKIVLNAIENWRNS